MQTAKYIAHLRATARTSLGPVSANARFDMSKEHEAEAYVAQVERCMSENLHFTITFEPKEQQS